MELISQKNNAFASHVDIVPATTLSSSWVEINTQALLDNLHMYKSMAPHSFFAPVIKSNAYGHGLDIVAHVCQKSSLVDMICVVSVSEALQIRAAGITKPILVLSILDNDLEKALSQDIQLTVYDIRMAMYLNTLGIALNKQVLIHIKVDTGLSRLGFLWDTASEHIRFIHTLSHIKIRGIFSHLAESENSASAFTDVQINRFQQVLYQCDQDGIQIPLVHTSCSAALTLHKTSHLSMIRLGVGIYGLWSSEQAKIETQKRFPHFLLKPVLAWKTKIIQLKQLPAGSYIGYDRTCQVSKPSIIAVLPVGYWDGYDRGLSNKGQVLVRNQVAFVLGRVAMNLMMVDVTHIKDVCVYDQVTLLGDHEEIHANTLAAMCNTINYEIVTRINPLLPRIAV